jgi:hypothetical protein
MAYRSVAYITDGTGGSVDTVSFATSLTGDVVIGFTHNFTASARPISNAGAVAFTGASSPSATSAGDAAWFLAPSDAVDVTCSVAAASAFQRFGYRGARKLYGAAIQLVTSDTITIPAVKSLRHGGRFFVSTMSETASRTVSSDDLGLGTVQASSTSSFSRHRWIGPPNIASYPGGSLTMSASAEWWTIYGWAI